MDNVKTRMEIVQEIIELISFVLFVTGKMMGLIMITLATVML